MSDYLKDVAIGTGVALLVGLAVLWLVAERGRLMRPSTWMLIREAGWRRFLPPTFWEGYYAGRWTNRYVKLLTFDIPAVLDRVPILWPAARRWMSDRYHAKIVPYEQARAILEIEQDIPLTDLEQVIPYPTARDLVLRAPPEITLYDCACRAQRENPCQPTMVCLVIGQPFSNFVLEHNPDTSRSITREEALRILEEEHERGHMHAAWFRKICMDRFYCICNCCPCCCAGIEGMTRLHTPMMTPSGFSARVDADLCRGCGSCERLCPFGARSVVDGTSRHDLDACMGCGVCVDRCPSGATSLVLDPANGLPLDVRELTAPRDD